MRQATLILITIFTVMTLCCCAVKRVTPILPCQDEALDNENFIRQLGCGSSKNMQSARTAALHDANQKLFLRFCDSIKTSNVRIKIDTVNTIYQMFVRSNDTISFSFGHAFGNIIKCCEKMTVDKSGTYHAFISVGVSTEDFGINISREKFRIYSSKKINDITKHQDE